MQSAASEGRAEEDQQESGFLAYVPPQAEICMCVGCIALEVAGHFKKPLAKLVIRVVN